MPSNRPSHCTRLTRSPTVAPKECSEQRLRADQQRGHSGRHPERNREPHAAQICSLQQQSNDGGVEPRARRPWPRCVRHPRQRQQHNDDAGKAQQQEGQRRRMRRGHFGHDEAGAPEQHENERHGGEPQRPASFRISQSGLAGDASCAGACCGDCAYGGNGTTRAPEPRLPGALHRREVHADRRGDVAAIASGHRHGDRHAERLGKVEDHAVARLHACGRKLELAQPIALVRVRARDVNQQLRLETAPHCREAIAQCRKVGIVAGAIRQRDVQGAGLLAEREVRGRVNREREHRRIAVKDLCSAIALVHVKVDDCDLKHASPARGFALHDPRGDRHIVEYAVAGTACVLCVVRAAGEVDRHAVERRRSARGDGGPSRAPRSLDHLRRPWKTDGANLGGIQSPGENALDILRRMGQRQLPC